MKKIKLYIMILLTVTSLNRLNSQTPVKMRLDEVIRAAIENNQSIKTSRLNIKKENAIKLKSFDIPKPEIFIEYEGVQGSLSNAESRKIGIVQQFEFPTNYFLRSDVQNSQVSIAKEELSVEINSLREIVKLKYNQLLLLNELGKTSKDNLIIYEQFLFTAEKKYEAGATSNLEVLGAKISKIKFENEIKNLTSQIRTVESDIRNLMNVEYDILPEGEFVFSELILSRENLVQNAMSNNPSLKMMNYRKEKFANTISLSKGELLPDISLKYFKQKLGSDNNYWGMEVGLGVPLWFWWAPSGKIKESGYELQIASNEETNLRKSLENDIGRVFEDYENNLRQVKFFNEEALKETNEILRQAKTSYEEGDIGYVEYLQALNLASETKTQYLNAIYSYNNSIINLEKLTAGEIK